MRQNLHIADRLAAYYASPGRSGVPLDELQSAAYEGLCAAALRYVEGHGSFERVALIWIKREIFRRIAAGTNAVSRPRNAIDRAREISRFRDRLAQRYGREVEDAELQRHLSPPARPPSYRARSTVETAYEITQLRGLLRPDLEQPVDLQAVDCPEPDIPPVSPLLQRFLEGFPLLQIAAELGESRASLKARITQELRNFFAV